jgi:two-component system chemotaxis sensor kinase CheA
MVRELTRAVQQLGRELRQAHDAAAQLRLVAAAALFAPLERTARDVARALGKRVHLVGRGGELRFDAQLLDGVLPALVQAVRNAVAHGIEHEGHVTVEVTRRGTRVGFTVRDDGRGIDLEAVRQAATRRGAAAGPTMSDEATLALLLRGGISTATEVTEISGRGVGLDVVREAAARLGGTARLDTSAGAGTTVELVVPSSLTSVEVLVVEAGGATTTIPLGAVRHTVRIAAAELTATEHGLAVLHGGAVVPFLPLPRALRQPVAAPRARAWTTVIVGSARGLAAIGVDRLRGTSSVVMRPLPALAPADPVIAGASLDAEGVPQLALDPDGLVAAAQLDRGAAEAPPRARRPVLVIDDSLTTRMLEQSILESAGWRVELATSAEEGLAKARGGDFGLFLVDVEMPGLDGFTFVELVRADAALRHIPAVLVTSRDSPDDQRRGREAGAQGHVVKSHFDQTALLALIDRLVAT